MRAWFSSPKTHPLGSALVLVTKLHVLSRPPRLPHPQEQLRTKKEARELSGATFRPDLSPSRQRAGEEFLVSSTGSSWVHALCR